MDADGDGSVTSEELKAGLTEAGLELSDADCEDMVYVVDRDGDGQIDLEEIRTLRYMEQELLQKSQSNMVSTVRNPRHNG